MNERTNEWVFGILSPGLPVQCSDGQWSDVKSFEVGQMGLAPSCMTWSELLILAERRFPVGKAGH